MPSRDFDDPHLERGSYLTESADKPPEIASISSLRTALAQFSADLQLTAVGGSRLEMEQEMDDPPRLLACEPLEAGPFQVRSVGVPEARIVAFLDGRQKSEQLATHRGIRLFVGSVGAVVRMRRDGRTSTWQMALQRNIYAPLCLIPDLPLFAAAHGLPVVDTSLGERHGDGGHSRQPEGDCPERHPLVLSRQAYHVIQSDRERLEITLAQRWIAEGDGLLMIDGGISRISAAETGKKVLGVVKTHRTMYVNDADCQVVLDLDAGERSSAFRVESRGSPVASWYLRLRRERGSDPLWALVRLEIPVPEFSPEWADALSRGVLAELSPISLPDSRWDRLLYGVRDCEMFLSAVL